MCLIRETGRGLLPWRRRRDRAEGATQRGTDWFREADGFRLNGIGVAVSADEKEDETDDAGQDEDGAGEDGEAEAAVEDGPIAGDGGAWGDLGAGKGGGEISADVVVVVEEESAEEDGDVAGDGAVGIGGDGAEEDGDVAVNVAMDVDGAEGAGDIACRVTLGDIDRGEDGDAVVTGAVVSGAEEGEDEDGGEEKF